MQQWEYQTYIIRADVDNTGWEKYREEQGLSPDWKPPKHTPATMIPELNKQGEEGWELITMQPVTIDENYDVYHPGQGEYRSNTYFCVWKRLKLPLHPPKL